jgi:type IV pilus assembly protein PilW
MTMSAFSRAHCAAPSKSRGAGIVELMVAATIGLVLIAGALSVFSNSRKSYNVNQDIGRMLENGNFALDEITRSLQLAGYWGRNNEGSLVRGRTGDGSFTPIATSNDATNDCTAGWYADVSKRIEGLNNTNAPYQTTCIPANRYSANTDVLVVRHVEPSAIPTASLVANTVYVRSDPVTAQLFVGTTIPAGLSAVSENFLLRSMAFYVSPNSVTATDAIPALRRVEVTAGPLLNVPAQPSADEIVVPGIENLQLQYGITTSGDARSANQYLDADNIAAANWANVVSVRVWLMVRSETAENGYLNTNTYSLPDGDFSPPSGDNFRRLLLTRTISLRNL